ncbi:hypothetical protein [Parvimonas sp. C2]|uniref:hypothetical protein n=1 Tax=Parvimonas sp. C2 TaxID=3110692 RepID=UPI002B482751|nr:hypothetical protein [Parvimonas sp. C2]MEB3073182.1 hypothetical protein [Parvimonas sp. C2]
MKKRNLVAICFVCLSFVGCNSFHTGKVVIDNKKKENKVENVEYIVVDEEDKESLIKNIKEGKGAVIDKKKNSNSEKDNNSNKNNKNNNNSGGSDR